MYKPMFSQNEPVDVQRRRQGTSSGPGGRPRAEAPVRRRPGDSGGSGGQGGGGFGTGGGGTLGTGGGGSGMRLPIWLIIPLVLCFIVYMVFFQGDGGGQIGGEEPAFPQEQQQEVEQQAAAPTNTSRPRPTRTPAPVQPGASGQDKAWTVMVYADADDQILEQDIFLDLNEAERVGSSDQVNIVAQVDRFQGGFRGDGNWSGTRRFFIEQDDDLTRLNSQMVDDLGEINMADGNALVDFVTWAMQAYPAQRYALILSDHGMGWPGGWSDGDSGGGGRSNIPIVSQLPDNMFLMEIDSALQAIQQQNGGQKLELVGMDACLMSHMEVYSMLQPYARFAVASQETEPSLGWAYSSFLRDLVNNPQMDGGDLGKLIVDSYIRDDQRIVDESARSEFLRQGSPMGGFYSQQLPSAAQVANQLSRDITITAVDLDAFPALMNQVNELAVALQDEDQSAVANARTYAQSFTNIFGRGQSPYIDLGSLVQMLTRSGSDQQVAAESAQVIDALQQAIIAEKHGAGKRGATGFSIYFPNSTLYRSPVSGPQSYTAVADAFAQNSLWDDFLAYHYNDVPIDPQSNSGIVPSFGGSNRAPGTGSIQVSPIRLSSSSAAPGSLVTMQADIKGTNIGYIYLFVGYFDPSANSIMIMDTDYLESPDTREQAGVYYPVWKENETFTMRLQWEPTVFQVSDGRTAQVVALTPQSYGGSAEDAVYTLDGTYTYTQDGQSRYARLYFRNGKLERVFGFEGDSAAGAPREIIPQTGDTFTIIETWMDLDSTGKSSGTSTQEGKTLTFGDNMFTWEEVYAPEGEYVVGFLVQDLDGNTQEVYAQVTVQ